MVLGFTVLMVAAAIVRFLTFDRYLPFWGHSDEPVYFLMVQNWRGLQDNPFVKYRYAGYPPAYPIINWGVQLLVEAFRTRPWTMNPEYIYAFRLLAAWIGITTTALIAYAGFLIAGPLAGWFAGLIWGLAPVIVDNNSLALPDPFVYFGSALAIVLALIAWRRQSPRWLFASLLAGIFVIYLKYSPIGALVPWGVIALILLKRNPRRMIPWLAAQLVIAALSAYWLIGVYGALNAPTREVETFRGAEALSFGLNPDRNLNNWFFAIFPIGLPLFVCVIIAAIVAYIYSRRRKWRTIPLLWVGIIVLYGIAGIFMSAIYTNAWLAKIRHTLPVTVALIPLFAAGLAQITWTLQSWLGERLKDHRYTVAAFIPALVVAFVFVTPAIAQDIQLVQDYERTDMHQIAWQWADNNLPVEGMMLSSPWGYMSYLFNRDWSAYDGVKSFLWWHTEKFDSTPAEYVQKGIAYFTAGDEDLVNTFNSPEAQAYIKQLTLVKHIPLSPNIAGESVYFYRMLPPKVSDTFNYGNQISLVGYDLDHTVLAPDTTLTFRPYWRIQQRPTSNYSVFVHLYPEKELKILAQDDGAPTTPSRPTLTWDDPEELYIGRDIKLAIPGDLPPGKYRLAMGLYDFNTGQRLVSPDGKDTFIIPITVGSSEDTGATF